MKILNCPDGSRIIYFTQQSYSVEEIIKLLEQYRDKKILSPFAYPCFRIIYDTIEFDDVFGIADNLDQMGKHHLADKVINFALGEEYICRAEDGQQLSIPGFFDKEGDE